MHEKETKIYEVDATTSSAKSRTGRKGGRINYSKKFSKESRQATSRSSDAKAGAITQNDIRTSVYNDERLFTREEVSLIVRDRVKKLNDRIQELEIELSIKEMNEDEESKRGFTATLKQFSRRPTGR